MARRRGIKERVHLPIYDAISLEPRKQLREVQTGSVLRFFTHTEGKSTLESNASLLSTSGRFAVDGMQVVLSNLPAVFPDGITAALRKAGGPTGSATAKIDNYLAGLEEKLRPLPEQIFGSDGGDHLIARLIYNTVTAFVVGDKTVVELPTCFFFSAAGPGVWAPAMSRRGAPVNNAGFRFAEPIVIDKQQNFHVEIRVPHARSMQEMQRIYGPLLIWVVLDGVLTRKG